MYENQVSKKTKKDNMVKTRTQEFQHNFRTSLYRVRESSSMNTLAGNLYTYKHTKQVSPKKTLKRASSNSMLAKVENPEGLGTIATKGLNTRASHISNYSDINTELILQRKRLQEYRALLREEIAIEKRKKNNADMNCKKLQNKIEHGTNSIKELNIRSDRLNQNIAETRQDANLNKRNRDDRINDNQHKRSCIARENQNCDNLDERCKMLKNNLLLEDKNRTNVKADLIKQQIVMNSASVLMSELEQERANLLLTINKSVASYKLE